MKITKKALSVLLSVIMIVSSMSVCFGIVGTAASGTVTNDQWNALYDALKADSVKTATFSTVSGKYVVDDPDGNVLKAVEAYFNVFNTLANKSPATGNPNNTSNTTGSTEGNRVIQQVNESIRNHLNANMPGYAVYVDTFIKNIIGTNSVSTSTGATLTVGGSSDTSNNKNLPTNNLSDVAPISITVVSSSAITGYTLDTLPDSVVTEKTFTVTHAKDRYDYTYATGSTSGCNPKTTYTRTYKFYYYISGVSSSDGAAINTQVIKDAQVVLEENAAYFSYTLDQLVELGFNDAAVLNTIKNAVVNAKNGVVNNFSASVYNHFFSAYNVEALVALIDKAAAIIAASGVAMNLNDYIEAGYADIITNKGALETLANNVKTLADKYDAYAADVKAYVESHDYEGETFDRAAVTAFYNAILKEIELIELRNLKDIIETEGSVFFTYNEENVTDGTVNDETGEIINSTVTGADLNLASGTIMGWISAIGTYDPANVAIVWEGIDIVDILTDLNTELARLMGISGHNDGFAVKYAQFITEVYKNTDIDADSEELFAAVQGYDSWYTGIKNLVAEIEAAYDVDIANDIIDGHDEIMKAHLDSKYWALHDRLLAQIELAFELYNELIGNTMARAAVQVTILNVDTFNQFEKALGHVEVDVYDFLVATPNFEMPAETEEKYNTIWTIALEDYHNFVTSGGFDRYQQTEIGDIVRPEAEGEHEAHIGDYTVTDEAVENIIVILEKLLADNEIKALLGDLINKDEEGNPTGEPFDIAALLTNLLNENLFSDALINTLVQFIYPAVANEFVKVWATLPETLEMPGMNVTGDFYADVSAALYIGTVETSIGGLDMPLFPKVLADKLREKFGDKYKAAADILEQYTTPAYCGVNENNEADDSTLVSPWTDVDFTQISWGVDEATNKREAFIDAACAALYGVEPLLLALVSNQAMNRDNASIGTGEGVLNNFKVYIDLSGATLDIKSITLNLQATPNEGYNNVIGPLLEMLGVESPDGNTFTTLRQFIVEGLLNPIDAVIAKIATNPLTTILELLPNLAYAVEMNMLLPKLAFLETQLVYSAGALIDVDLDAGIGSVGSFLLNIALGLLGDSLIGSDMTLEGTNIKNFYLADVYANTNDPKVVKLSDVIKVEDLLSGADISCFEGLWDMIMGMLNKTEEGEEAGPVIDLPCPDAGYIATLGKLTWKDTVRSKWGYTPLQAGKAAYIEANRADVLIYLLRYVLNAVTPDLLASFGLELTDDIKAIIEDVTADPDKTIAAIVELLNGVEYDTLKEYVWYVSEVNEGNVVGMTPAIHQYLGYDNNWRKETATYLLNNIEEIIGAVMTMVGGEDAEPFELSAVLTDLIAGLFTNKNITALAKLLSQLDLNALLAGDADAEEGTDEEIETVAEGEEAEGEEAPTIDVNALVNKFAGIDLTGFAAYADLADDYNWGFEDGDKAGFVAALVNLLAPLEPVLDFILAGENHALLGGDVELIGYSGYDSAIVPLLEALGAAPAALGEDDNALEAVLNALLARVDEILADPIDEILNLIPSVLYFIKSNGLTTAVRNLLQPVLVIIETIDPIYALNLNELIGGLTADLGFTLDLGNLGFEAIFDILGAVVALDLTELEEIIDDVCEVIAPVDYTSASSLIGEKGKKGAYGEFFDAADLLTVLVSFALSWVQEGNNANDIVALIAGDDAEKAAEIQKYITGAITIIAGIEPEYQQIDWDYGFPADYDDSIFESGLVIEPTINTIKYPTYWTEDAAKYISDNLNAIVADVLGATGGEYASVSELLKANVSIYSTENVDAIVAAVANLLVDIDEVLVNTVGLVLGADIEALKAYKAPEGIDTAEEFVAALTEILTTIEPVINWLLFGEDYAFFSKSGTDLVTIKGAEGYAYGLAPILEALGVETPAMDEANIENILNAVFARVDAIFNNPVDEIFALIPNVVYFLNANGVSVSVQNLLAGVTGLIGTVSEEFGVEIDLMTIFNDLINGLLPEDTTVTLDVANLDLESIFALIQELLGLDLTPIADILVDLCVGNIVVYTSASGEYGFKMQYNDEFARHDMITIIVSCLLQVIKLDANEESLKNMLGEEIYDGILNVISLTVNVPVQEFDWALTESADTGEVFSALQSSELFGEFRYGPLYTKEMEQYISDNFGEFVDNIIYLLGLEINGSHVESLTELLNGLVGGSVYNSDIVITIRDALAGVVAGLETDIPAGSHILEVLKAAGLADLKAIAEVEVPEFKDDRAMFVATLCEVLEPLYTVLEWLLADADITFFIDEAEEILITLPGAEGYAFGLVPVLEALDCEGILTREEYNAAVEADRSVLITSILTPLLDRVDEILLNPAEEILSILPNLIYFINSNGVDTVVKNTLNAVYTLLNAIEPIAKIDLYELIGLDLETLTFEKLFDMAIEMIAEATGYELTALHADAIVELTTGTLESYTSANGLTAYRMVYQAAEAKGEMVTVVLRLAVKFLALEKNVDAIIGILENNLGMTADAKKYVEGVLTAIVGCLSDTRLGMDLALYTIYNLFYSTDIGVGETTNGYNDLNAIWRDALAQLSKDSPEAGKLIEEILGLDIFEDLLDTDKIAPNGFIAFFEKIIELFNKLVEWFKNIFA